MDIVAFKTLEKDADGVYDITEYTFSDGSKLTAIPFVLDKRHEMRPDLVSYDMFGTVDMVSAVVEMNGVVNPYAVSEGDALFYASREEILEVTANPAKLDALKRQLVNAQKRNRSDSSRQTYKGAEKERESAKKAPTIMMPVGKKSVETRDGMIKLNPSF